jgi:hypothetical protein
MTGYTRKLDLAALGSSYYPNNYPLAPYRPLTGGELVLLFSSSLCNSSYKYSSSQYTLFNLACHILALIPLILIDITYLQSLNKHLIVTV